MKTIDLTLAICMYNAERYIEDTLQSVFVQTFQDFHLLIVNDCSTDGSVDAVERFFDDNPRQYELVNFEENKGIGYARHFAERHAETRYMMFLDADDILYPMAVETMYNKIISDADLMAVGCYLEYIDREGKKIGGGLYLGEKTKEDFYEKARNKKLIFMQPTAVYDREVALSVGGYVIDGYPPGKPRYRDYCEDLDLWTRMSDLYVEGKAIVVVPEVLCKYRKASGLSTGTFNMSLKMKYTKTNLLRRRAGEKELTFVDFYEVLSEKDIMRLKKDAAAADALRNGVFYFRQGFWGKAVVSVLKSLWYKPGYLYQKIKSNSGLKK